MASGNTEDARAEDYEPGIVIPSWWIMFIGALRRRRGSINIGGHTAGQRTGQHAEIWSPLTRSMHNPLSRSRGPIKVGGNTAGQGTGQHAGTWSPLTRNVHNPLWGHHINQEY